MHRPQNRDLKNLEISIQICMLRLLRLVLIGAVASASALRVAPFAATGNVRAFVSANAKSLYSLTAKKSDGTTLDLKSLSGKPCLMVNVASR